MILESDNMIKINNNTHEKILSKILFGHYEVTQDGKKRKGEAPFISFKFDDAYLGLELIYDKMELKELPKNEKKDISRYVSDITYEDKKGWISLIIGIYKCYVTRIEDDLFNFELTCDVEEYREHYSILLNENVKIIFE